MVTSTSPIDVPAEVIKTNGHTVHDSASETSVITPTNVKFRIGRDALNTAVAGLPDEHRETLTWLWSYCSQHNLSRERMGSLIAKTNGKGHYSFDSLYHAMTGGRTADGTNLNPLCQAIEAFRRQVAPAQDSDSEFIETRLVREIWAYARKVQAKRRPGYVIGNQTNGKTTALTALAASDPNIVYTRMPTRGHLCQFSKECARRLAMGHKQTVGDLYFRIFDSFTRDSLLIIDEADQCFGALRHTLGISTLDYIREIYDHAKCGILFVMDQAGRNEMIRGQWAEKLGRLWRRRVPQFNLPRVPYREDLDLFAAHYGLSPAADELVRVRINYVDDEGVERSREHSDNPARIQRDVVSSAQGGLGIWLQILDEAAEIAKAARKPITWGAVIKAHCEFVAAESDGTEVAR